MQTTLRIEDRLYREAKAKAAREGVTLTRFIEEGLRLRLGESATPKPGGHQFRVFSKADPDPRSWDEIRRIADAEEEAHDLTKLGIPEPKTP